MSNNDFNNFDFDKYISELPPNRFIRTRASVLKQLKEHQTTYPTIFNNSCEELLCEDLFKGKSLEELYLENSDLFYNKFILKLKRRIQNNIELERSFIDVAKLVDVIQNKEGLAFQAFTSYNCKFCNEQQIWNNGNVPDLCNNCAKELAIKIARHSDSILKE